MAFSTRSLYKAVFVLSIVLSVRAVARSQTANSSAGLRVANAPGAPASPAPGTAVNQPDPAPPQSSASGNLPPGRLDGIYAALRSSDVYANTINHDYLVFLPDGSVMRSLPPEGLDGFDFQAYTRAQASSKYWTGRYRADGNDIEIAWNNSPDNREYVKRNEQGSEVGRTYIPLCRCNGKRFAGAYLLGGDTPLAMQFSLDGTFADNGVADDRGYFPDSFSYNRRPGLRPGRGTYEIKNYTIVMRYTDGRVLRKAFLAPAVQEASQVFDWIAFTNINNMYRQGYQRVPF
jgi:hypothetical protein